MCRCLIPLSWTPKATKMVNFIRTFYHKIILKITIGKYEVTLEFSLRTSEWANKLHQRESFLPVSILWVKDKNIVSEAFCALTRVDLGQKPIEEESGQPPSCRPRGLASHAFHQLSQQTLSPQTPWRTWWCLGPLVFQWSFISGDLTRAARHVVNYWGSWLCWHFCLRSWHGSSL